MLLYEAIPDAGECGGAAQAAGQQNEGHGDIVSPLARFEPIMALPTLHFELQNLKDIKLSKASND